MLENANWAPTHRLTEPWRFVVFKGEGLKTLAKFQSELYRELSTMAGKYDEAKDWFLKYDAYNPKDTRAITMAGACEKAKKLRPVFPKQSTKPPVIYSQP